MNPRTQVIRGGHVFNVENGPITDSWHFWDLWSDGNWEAPVLDYIDRLLHPGDVFLDIGAWIGPMTIWAASKGALVTAIEPDPEAYRQLAGNVEANHYAERVTLVNAAAASGRNGTTTLWSVMEWGQSASSTALAQGEPQTVPTVGIVPLARRLGPALVKMDIEGGERDLMPVLGPLLRSRKVPLLLSLHPVAIEDPALCAELEHWSLERLAAAGDSYLALPN